MPEIKCEFGHKQSIGTDAWVETLTLDQMKYARDQMAEKIKAATSSLLDSKGFFASKDTQLKEALKRNTQEINRINDRASSAEALLTARYVALDTQMSKLNALNAYVAQQVTTWNKRSD